jgi:hypothetical protein
MQDKELKNYMFKNYHKKIYTYNPGQYQFVDILKKIYNVEILSMLANDKINNQVVDFYTDSQKTEILQFYNSSLFQNFVDEYIRFLKNEIPNVFPNEKFIIYQSKPTYRIHEKNNLSVGEWHRDSQDNYFHYLNTINFYLPFTDLNESNTIWMCKNIQDNTNTNIEPILLKNNEFTSNYFAGVLHGNKINNSEFTRISIDFRIIPGSLYDETKMTNTSSSNRKLKIGDYYSIMNF